MKQEKIKRVEFYPTYNKVKIWTFAEPLGSGKKYVLESGEASQILVEALNKGYALELKPRQTYYRIKIKKETL